MIMEQQEQYLENNVSTMNCEEKPELEELATEIPNKWVSAKLLEIKERMKPSMPQWDGYYPQPDPRLYPYPPFFTVGDWVKALTSIQLFKESDWEWRVIAGAGGLVLCRGASDEQKRRVEGVQVVRTAQRVAGRRQKSSTRRQKSKAAPESTCPCCSTWAPLVVFNPVTKQLRTLPKVMACEDRNGEPWDYVGVQAAQLIERSDLSYEVILVFKSCVFVYSSTTHMWRRYQCQRPTAFAVPQVKNRPWSWIVPWTCVGGRLYCMDAVRDGPGKHVVSLFEVDYEAETWKRRGHFTVRKRHWNVSRLDPAFQPTCSVDMDTRLSLEMVECMGELYVVIAAGADEHLTTDYTSAFTVEEYQQFADIPGLDTYPIQFHILNLKDGFNDDRENSDDADDGRDSFQHRILRMVLPQSPKPLRITPDDEVGHDRKQVVLSVYENAFTGMERWFFCVARGSKIFVCFFDHLLQFDVVTGESKTGIISDEKMFGTRDTVYFPNASVMP